MNTEPVQVGPVNPDLDRILSSYTPTPENAPLARLRRTLLASGIVLGLFAMLIEGSPGVGARLIWLAPTLGFFSAAILYFQGSNRGAMLVAMFAACLSFGLNLGAGAPVPIPAWAYALFWTWLLAEVFWSWRNDETAAPAHRHAMGATPTSVYFVLNRFARFLARREAPAWFYGRFAWYLLLGSPIYALLLLHGAGMVPLPEKELTTLGIISALFPAAPCAWGLRRLLHRIYFADYAKEAWAPGYLTLEAAAKLADQVKQEIDLDPEEIYLLERDVRRRLDIGPQRPAPDERSLTLLDAFEFDRACDERNIPFPERWRLAARWHALRGPLAASRASAESGPSTSNLPKSVTS